MSVYLKVGGTDLSGFITENSYKVSCEPVYDEEGTFTNFYGETIRTLIGRNITVSAVLTDVDDRTAEALRQAAMAEKIQTEYSFPDTQSGMFSAEKLSISLDSVRNGQKFWSAELVLKGFAAEDGL